MKKSLKLARKACRDCGDRRAVSTYRGHVCWRPQHDLCPRCWRAAMDSQHAAQLLGLVSDTQRKAA
jgi:hypothetical protein